MAKLIVLVTLFRFVTMSIEARKFSNEMSLTQKFDPLDGNSSIETSVISPELLGSVAPPKPPPATDTIVDNAWPSDPKRIVEKNKWCIAKPSTSETQLGANIKFVCNQPWSIVDCKVIKPGGSCFHPNNTVSHASVVMNMYYRNTGKHDSRCNFNGSALIVFENPSSGRCVY